MLTFEESTHTYRLDGEVVPSVTEIIRFISIDTAAKADPWLRKAAAERGSKVHELTILVDYGEDVDDLLDYETEPYIRAYKNFLRDYDVHWTHTEIALASEVHRFAGTVDRIGTIDGIPCVVDFKTGAKNKKALSAQLAGYRLLIGENVLPYPTHSYGLYLRKDGTYELTAVDDPDGMQAFSICLALNNHLKPAPKKTKQEETTK